jgi:hypothetical protein
MIDLARHIYCRRLPHSRVPVALPPQFATSTQPLPRFGGPFFPTLPRVFPTIPSDFERPLNMPFMPERDADADGPVAWPGPPSPVEEFRNPLDHPVDPTEAVRNLKRKNSGEKHMTLKDFINISISMAGAQIAWTLELGYVNPFNN